MNWKSYYNDETENTGCAASTNVDQSAPLTPATNSCKLYGNKKDDYELNSCKNIEKSSLFNTTFKNITRPDFCMDVNAANNPSVVGMARCDGSYGQSFQLKDNMILNKMGVLVAGGMLQITDIKNKNNENLVTIVPQLGGGVLIKGNINGNTPKCYGPFNNSIIMYPFDCDPVKNPGIVWNSAPVVPSPYGLGGNSPPPQGYKWQCDIVKA